MMRRLVLAEVAKSAELGGLCSLVVGDGVATCFLAAYKRHAPGSPLRSGFRAVDSHTAI